MRLKCTSLKAEAEAVLVTVEALYLTTDPGHPEDRLVTNHTVISRPGEALWAQVEETRKAAPRRPRDTTAVGAKPTRIPSRFREVRGTTPHVGHRHLGATHRSLSNDRRSKSGLSDQSSPPRRPRDYPGNDQNRDAKSNSRQGSKFVPLSHFLTSLPLFKKSPKIK